MQAKTGKARKIFRMVLLFGFFIDQNGELTLVKWDRQPRGICGSFEPRCEEHAAEAVAATALITISLPLHPQMALR